MMAKGRGLGGGGWIGCTSTKGKWALNSIAVYAISADHKVYLYLCHLSRSVHCPKFSKRQVPIGATVFWNTIWLDVAIVIQNVCSKAGKRRLDRKR